MNSVVLQRLSSNEKQTIGNLRVVDGSKKTVFECRTIELADKNNRQSVSRIPSGTYYLAKLNGDQLQWSRFDYPHLHIQNVPNRSGIKIHIGNYYSQIAGCVLVGDRFADINGDGYVDVANSKNTLNKLLNLLPNRTKIDIKDEKPIEELESAGLIPNDVKSISDKLQEIDLA